MRQKNIHPCPKFLGSQIRTWRKSKSITQQMLATATSIKLRHLQEIEAGRVDMKVRTLGLIAMALKITPQALLTPFDQNRASMCESCKKM